MFNFYFSNIYFVFAVISVVTSVALFQFEKRKLSHFFLYLGSFLLGLFVIQLDPFINLWDEQYHALVAKNMMTDPFKPMLIKDPVLGYSKENWADSHIWMHKQPLFLWQMALSMKLFGANEIGIRLPSVVMHTVLIFFIYRTGKIFFSPKTGYYSALFFTCAYFPLAYLTGFYATDHNDYAFLFYGFASIWAFIEYNESKKPVYLILIGFLSGAAILCKWLTGLLVYGIWAVVIFCQKKNQGLRKPILDFLLSFLVCFSIFLPWQIFAFLNYPEEFNQAMLFNRRHIFEPLEGHDGGFFFYYDALYEQFGEGALIPPFILLSLGFMIYSLIDKTHKIISSLTILTTYLFFSIVSTKMYGYVFVTFPFFIIGVAKVFVIASEKLIQTKNKYLKTSIFTIFSFLVLILLFDFPKIYKYHSNKERGRSRAIDIKEKAFYQAFKNTHKDEKCLIFNCNTTFNSNIIGIFYTDFPCYSFILSEDQLKLARKLDYQLFAVDDGTLPPTIKNDVSIKKIIFDRNVD